MDTAGMSPARRGRGPAGPDSPPSGSAATVEVLHARLLPWFAGHRRPLPFREDRSPWKVLVAEFMLQQTQAEAVAPYLQRFLARFPDPAALAAASEEEVLALWQGLGYYRRARHLHQAATHIVRDHGGQVPASREALNALPGVGPYIAGAVGAFAFGDDVAAFDANALRVLSRLFDLDRATGDLAQRLVPPGRAAEWNEALMDFGSLVCTPRVPRCAICPVADLCRGRSAGRADRLPIRPDKRARPETLVCTLVVRDVAGRIGLVRRPDSGLLAGMWECPSIEGAVSAEDVAMRHGLRVHGPVTALPPFRHVFTHRVWSVRPFSTVAAGPVRWVDPADLAAVPLAGPTARLLAGAPPVPAK